MDQNTGKKEEKKRLLIKETFDHLMKETQIADFFDHPENPLDALVLTLLEFAYYQGADTMVRVYFLHEKDKVNALKKRDLNGAVTFGHMYDELNKNTKAEIENYNKELKVIMKQHMKSIMFFDISKLKL